MPDLEDFHAFTSTTSDKSGGTSGCLPWAVGIYFLVWILCRLFG